MASGIRLVAYELSGKLGLSPMVAPLAGISIAIILGGVYSYISVYSPIFGIISFFALFFLLFAVGYPTGYVAKVAQCRSVGFVGLVGLACGLATLGSSWVFFIYALINREAVPGGGVELTELISAGTLWDYIVAVNENGWFTVFGITPQGILLWVMWGLEAVIIVIGIAGVATLPLLRQMYCEDCRKWCAVEETRYLEPTPAMMSANVTDIKLEDILALSPLPDKSFPCICCEVLRCPNCDETQGLRFSRLRQQKVSDGKVTEHCDEIAGVFQPSSETE
jgi:hypothetical protein